MRNRGKGQKGPTAELVRVWSWFDGEIAHIEADAKEGRMTEKERQRLGVLMGSLTELYKVVMGRWLTEEMGMQVSDGPSGLG